MANRNPPTAGLKRDAGPGRPKGSKNRITQEWVEKHLRWRVDFDPRVFAEKCGKGQLAKWTLREIAKFPPEVAMCIESYDVVLGNIDHGDGALETVVKIRWYPKDKPLELCARSLGMLKDHVVIEDLNARKTRLRAALALKGSDAD